MNELQERVWVAMSAHLVAEDNAAIFGMTQAVDAAVETVFEWLIADARNGEREYNVDCHACEINADIARWLQGKQDSLSDS